MTSNPSSVNLDPRLLEPSKRPLLELDPDAMLNRDAWAALFRSDDAIRNCNQNLDALRRTLIER